MLLYVGRLGVEKNLYLFKDILDKIAEIRKLRGSKAVPDVELVFVGSGPAEGVLKDLFRHYTNVVFTGQLRGQVIAVLCSIIVFLL